MDMGKTAGPRPARTPNEREERTWLRQQQDPTASFSRIMAFRLTGALDAERLAAALAAVLRAVPGLDVRYRFDDDGELRKEKPDGAVEGPILRLVGSRAEALNSLLAEQGRPWDLEQEAPVRLGLFPVSGDGAVLGVIAHRVLDGTVSWAQVFTALAHAYAGQDFPTPGAVATAGPAHAEEAGICWLRRPIGLGTTDVADLSRTSWLAPELRNRAGARHAITLDTAPLLPLTSGRATPRAALAAATVLFGRFLLRLTAAVELKLTIIDGAAELGLPLTPDTDLRLRLQPGDTAEEAVARLLAGGEPCAGSATGPGVVVTWLSGPKDFLPLAGLAAERLALPSLDAGADLALGLAPAAEGRLAVDLATGPALSPTAGAFMLERFAAFVQGEEVVLPALLGAAPSCATAAPNPAPGPEADLAGLILAEFRRALGRPDMGPDDDFFDQGGHSLIATRVIGRLLAEHHVEVQFNDLFGNPTAAALGRLARRQAGAPAAAPAPVPGPAAAEDAPLSLAQQSLWKVYAAFGFGDIFNIPFGLRFLDPVDEHVFERAFLDLMERHPALRTRFVAVDGTVRQVVVPVADLEGYKWFWYSHESGGLEERASEAAHRFDLARELPLRLRFLTDRTNGQQVLSLLFHHIVLDEWSVNLLMEELNHAYRHRQNGDEPLWTDAPRPFRDFAALQQAVGLDGGHLAYWTNRLRGVPKGMPLLGPPQTDGASPAGAAGGWVELKLDPTTVDGLYAQAKATGASLFNVVYAAIAAALHGLGAPDDLAIGTSASGRTDPAFFDTIGYFTTVVCHRVRIAADATIGGLVRHVRDTVNESMPYTDVPIDLVEEALGHDAMAAGGHMFEVFIQLHAKNKLNGALALEDGDRIEFRQVDPDKSESFLGLQFEVLEETIAGESIIRVMMSYRADHYDATQVDAIGRAATAMFTRFATADAGAAALAPVALRPAG
ncbi:condensation domain-containing protein [Novispirillum sp. DQ9]|uniref:condensation domain-containing protein n=1 Tax=Novispirillum sp. DQ9 TaxID=3398612 RepID=UPI003C7AD1C6